MSILIISYQRRSLLACLLGGLAQELIDVPDLRHGLDVVVVLDGSTDGSRELLETMAYPVPLRAVWQPNRGRAGARNAGIAVASGELVWFLDDDLRPAPGLVARHRRVHDPSDRRIVMGPCFVGPDRRVHPVVRKFWASWHAELARTAAVDRFDRFSVANTSGPLVDFVEAGRFDERFVGYGAEDYELAVRLLAAGHEIAYDATAVTWQVPSQTAVEICRRWAEEGRNLARLVAIHPQKIEAAFPSHDLRRRERVIRTLRLYRAPWLLQVLSSLLLPLVALEERVTRQRRWRLLDIAATVRFIATVARHDPDGRLTARILALTPERS